MRHVSRTHRVALDWLFDRINLDPKIQIKYIVTKSRLADMLTEGNFIRDEWNHLLRLFNIMKFSVFSCSYFLSIFGPNTMSKGTQERKTGEEPVLAKLKPMSLVSKRVSANQSPTLDSCTSYSLENCRLCWNSDLTSTEKSGRDRNEKSASSSEVWHKNVNPFPSAERSGREVEQRSSSGKLGREVQNQLTEVKLNHHNLEISNTRYIENVFANVRQKVDSSRRRPDCAGPISQCTGVEIVYVNDTESSDLPLR